MVLYKNAFISLCSGRSDDFMYIHFKVISEINKLYSADCEKTVTVLCSANLCEYKSHAPSNDLAPPFLRTLTTDSCQVLPPCPYLETPNVVAGLPSQGEFVILT